MKTGKLVDRHFRKLDEGLLRDAKAQAAQQGKSLGEWMNEAIDDELNFIERAETHCRENGWREPA